MALINLDNHDEFLCIEFREIKKCLLQICFDVVLVVLKVNELRYMWCIARFGTIFTI